MDIFCSLPWYDYHKMSSMKPKELADTQVCPYKKGQAKIPVLFCKSFLSSLYPFSYPFFLYASSDTFLF